MTESLKDQSAVLASLMTAIPGTSFNTAVYKLIDALHYLVANTPPVEQPGKGDHYRCGDLDCCPPVHEEQPAVSPALRVPLVELASAWRRRGLQLAADGSYASALAQCAAELDVVTVAGHASAVDLTDEYRIRRIPGSNGWDVLNQDGSSVLDAPATFDEAKDVWERLNAPRTSAVPTDDQGRQLVEVTAFGDAPARVFLPGEQITGATFIRQGKAHHVVNDIEPGPGHEDTQLHWGRVGLLLPGANIEPGDTQTICLDMAAGSGRQWVTPVYAREFAAELLSAAARAEGEATQ